jgi:hypothetical protein
MRRLAPFLCVLALAACGGHGSRTAADPCAFPPPPRVVAAAGAPTGADLVSGSLRNALAAQDVHVDVRLALGARYDAARAAGGGDPALVRLARHRWCLAFRGVRTRAGLSGSGVLEQAGTRTPFALVLSRSGFYLRLHGRWYGELQFSTTTMFSSEDVAGAIPADACIRTQSEGCDRVDVRPLLTKGLLGHVFAGRVGRARGGFALDGTLDPEGFVRLMGRLDDPASYDPYARNGRVLYAIGADGRPRLFELRWRLDRAALIEHRGFEALQSPVVAQSFHLRIALSRWGEAAPLGIPAHATPFSESQAERLFSGFLLVATLYG